MKNKTEKQIEEMWQEHLSGRSTPTSDEICKQALEELYVNHDNGEKTNFQMHKEITLLYENNNKLDFNTINKVFNLEDRSELDLKNLCEFIIVITLMCGQDVPKKEAAHEKRCNLMTVLIEAITSVLCCI